MGHSRGEGRTRFLGLEPLERRQLLAGDPITQASVAESQASHAESADIGYFLVEDDTRVERYDIAGESWLTSIDLPDIYGSATAVHVDADGLYVAYGKTVYRYNLDGSGQTHLLNTLNDVRSLHSDGNLLFINHSANNYARFVSIDKTTNTVLDTIDGIDFIFVDGSSLAPEVNRIFGRSVSVSPADIVYVNYDDDGNLTRGGDSPHHGDYPDATQTWTFPDSDKVVDDSGNVYSTSTLTWLNSFPSSIDDVDFLGSDIPIVLEGNTITSYTNALLPAGSHTLSNTPDEIYINDTHVITFTENALQAHGYEVELVPLSQLNPPTPGQPVSPIGLSYTPDHIEMAADGTVLLYSSRFESIFRWDPQRQRYGDTIPVIGSAELMAYSAENNTIYLSYTSGLIRQIALGGPQPIDTPFTTLPNRASVLSTAGPYVFISNSSGASRAHRTFAPDGSEIDSVNSTFYYSAEFVWSEANQKMYFLNTNTYFSGSLHSEEINADGSTYPSEEAGGIGQAQRSSPSQGYLFSTPVRVAPDGSVAVLGSGVIHDATTLERFNFSLDNYLTDAAWLGDELYTIRNVDDVSEIQQWTGPTYELVDSVRISGAAASLQPIGDNRLLAISVIGDETTNFTVLNSELKTVEVPGNDTPGLYNPATATFLFRDANDSDTSDLAPLNNGIRNGIPLSGDWNGDGIETIGVYDPAAATFLLHNSYVADVSDMPAFNYGIPNWIPLTGDWDGDGIDTIGVYDPESAVFFLRNTNDSGEADLSAFNYGISGWEPLAGDWDGDGIDTIGVYNPQTATFFLRNSNDSGTSDVAAFNYGIANWVPLVGDWDADGIDTVGVYNPSTATFFLRNSNDTGVSDVAPFNYGVPGWVPVVGDWVTGSTDIIVRDLAFAALDSAAAAIVPETRVPEAPGGLTNWSPDLLLGSDFTEDAFMLEERPQGYDSTGMLNGSSWTLDDLASPLTAIAAEHPLESESEVGSIQNP